MTEPRDRAILETAVRHLRKHELLCFETPTTPRSWSLPPEPPEDVTRLRDVEGVIWGRYGPHWRRCDEVLWIEDFGRLLWSRGPLTEVTDGH